MPIDEEKLKEMIEPRAEVEELSSISSDGRNLLTRVPKNIVDKTNMKKGQTLRWLVDNNTNKINLELIKEEDGQNKKND